MEFKFDFKEIFEAWVVARNPKPHEKELANRRYEICLSCEFRKQVVKSVEWSEVCSKCGCPLKKKVFSKMHNPCPLKKWDIVDRELIEVLSDKDVDTII